MVIDQLTGLLAQCGRIIVGYGCNVTSVYCASVFTMPYTNSLTSQSLWLNRACAWFARCSEILSATYTCHIVQATLFMLLVWRLFIVHSSLHCIKSSFMTDNSPALLWIANTIIVIIIVISNFRHSVNIKQQNDYHLQLLPLYDGVKKLQCGLGKFLHY